MRCQSFYPEDSYGGSHVTGAVVSRLNQSGVAYKAGLRVEDCVVAINSIPIYDPLSAAKRLRDSAGDLRLTVNRQTDTSEVVGDAMRSAGRWINEVLTPRGSSKSLIDAMGQGLHRMLAGQAKNNGATAIAAHWRGFRMRELCNTWWWAASDIQMHVRGWQVRRITMPILRAQAAEVAAAAAEARAELALKQMDAALEEARRAEEAARVRYNAANESVKAAEEEQKSEPVSARGTLKGIKRALSFNSKKKRRPQQPQPEAEEISLSDCSESSISPPSTPPHKSPRDVSLLQSKYSATPLAPQTAPQLDLKTPSKKTPSRLRRSLSWTQRTKKHMAADNQKQEESAA